MRRQGMPNRARCHKIPWLFRMVRDTARSAVHERREQGRGKRWSAPPKREIEMQHDRVRKASGGKWLGIAAGISLTLGGCGGAAEATLPADRQESAALCYGATLALAQEKVGKADRKSTSMNSSH